MPSLPGVARRAWVSRTLMRPGDEEVTSATVCQGPAARAKIDKKTQHPQHPTTPTKTMREKLLDAFRGL